jgi:hypothetical protein
MRSSTLTVDKTTAEKPRAVLARSEAAERMLALTGTTRLSDADLAVTMFGFPLILTLANAVDGYRSTAKDGRGRRQHFPTAALIAISAIARYVGSLPAALRVLNDFDVWHRCRRAWESLAGVGELPDAPPPRSTTTSRSSRSSRTPSPAVRSAWPSFSGTFPCARPRS